MTHKKEKYQKNYDKYHKMTGKMREDIQRLETSNQELMDEVKVLMSQQEENNLEEFPAYDDELAELGNMGDQPSIIDDQFAEKSSDGSQDGQDHNSSLLETGLLNGLAN